MSREDPQLRIRLPVELKEKIDDAAKSNNRSMNAEIVQRLDASFLNEMLDDEVVSADEALRIANNAKDELSNIIFKRTFAEINKKARMGHKEFCIILSDLELEYLTDDDFNASLSKTLTRLSDLGYVVPEKSIDGGGFLVEIPNKKTT
ncbi:Arc family DNA-binding protein [Citrobacter koseri]|uniref:Arc family DNA-binding protein n=1 Tax=Citrobacter koseri TaxID=545 RepID=UPI001902696E|nr:Arc family DNA-binding protein [Citrobacter koseri]MBJ8938574.1 Arc family DNA-binding protein [Citrobacter koseri]MBJ9303700.1 Arc family DNA-binding protein [Citrobacter koseri]MBJ9368206.1 Arc family DNA-binding protein [Citrobacter koseri]